MWALSILIYTRYSWLSRTIIVHKYIIFMSTIKQINIKSLDQYSRNTGWLYRENSNFKKTVTLFTLWLLFLWHVSPSHGELTLIHMVLCLYHELQEKSTLFHMGMETFESPCRKFWHKMSFKLVFKETKTIFFMVTFMLYR